MILIIDNYDSFTWNLVQRIGELDGRADIRVVRNDKITPAEAAELKPERIIISPGPCTPREAGVSNGIIEILGGVVPILGVCLGHQCIGSGAGMVVHRHPHIMHGKTSQILHDKTGVFAGLSDPFIATRYHSLVVERGSAQAEGWSVSAWTEDVLENGETVEVVMGLRRDWDAAPLEGVQFHPESFLTDEGPALLKNFLDY